MNSEPLLLDATPIHVSLISLDLDDFYRRGINAIIFSIKAIEDECELINVAVQLQDPYSDLSSGPVASHIYHLLSKRLEMFCPCWLITDIYTYKIKKNHFTYKTQATKSSDKIKFWHLIKLVPVGLMDLVNV